MDNPPQSGEITVDENGNVVIGAPLAISAATPPTDEEDDE